MSDIAVAASVGRATLYHHFEAREALIKKLVIFCSLMNGVSAEDPAETLSDYLFNHSDKITFGLTHLWQSSQPILFCIAVAHGQKNATA